MRCRFATSYSGPDGSLSYGYDNDNELTSVTGARSENFSYDLNGNRNMAGYTTGTGNELTSDGTYTYTYDNEGNTLTKTNTATGDKWSYTWDFRNRLTEAVEKTSGNVLENDEKFTYDVNDKRIGVWLNGSQQSWMVFDGANPYMDFNGSGTLTERYLTDPRGLSLFYGQVDGSGAVNWYLTDNIGSVRQIVNTSGTVMYTLTYSSFGTLLSPASPPSGYRFLFAGGAYDSITGNYQFGSRYYGPGYGRFVTQDPLGFGAGDANLYRYVGNNPTTAVDSSGLALEFVSKKNQLNLELPGFTGAEMTALIIDMKLAVEKLDKALSMLTDHWDELKSLSTFTLPGGKTFVSKRYRMLTSQDFVPSSSWGVYRFYDLSRSAKVIAQSVLEPEVPRVDARRVQGFPLGKVG